MNIGTRLMGVLSNCKDTLPIGFDLWKDPFHKHICRVVQMHLMRPMAVILDHVKRDHNVMPTDVVIFHTTTMFVKHVSFLIDYFVIYY